METSSNEAIYSLQGFFCQDEGAPRIRPVPITPPDENPLAVTSENDIDTEVGSIIFTPATAEAGDPIAEATDVTRGHLESKKINLNDSKGKTLETCCS